MLRITTKKIGGLFFININGRYQISFCRLQANRNDRTATRYVKTHDDQFFHAADIEPRHSIHHQRFNLIRLVSSLPRVFTKLTRYVRHSIDSLDTFSSASTPSKIRVEKYLNQSPSMIESREIEWWIMRLLILPTVFIWSVMLIEAADRMNWF